MGGDYATHIVSPYGTFFDRNQDCFRERNPLADGPCFLIDDAPASPGNRATQSRLFEPYDALWLLGISNRGAPGVPVSVSIFCGDNPPIVLGPNQNIDDGRIWQLGYISSQTCEWLPINQVRNVRCGLFRCGCNACEVGICESSDCDNDEVCRPTDGQCIPD